MYGFLLFLYILICLALMGVILLQSGRGSGLAGVFGGSAMGTVFGGRGAVTFLSKVTTVLATLFLLLSLLLAMIVERGGRRESLVAKERQKQMVIPAANLPAAGVEPEAGLGSATSGDSGR
ncbi:MAG: preprotein translocase subunit SecG [candidate division KSB1 bacterium]|nr:preprotein translocase subunit SecG [candidate division KSB1 bacterium]